jgi:alkylated DNA repair protein (DNA oxidative demethylase)
MLFESVPQLIAPDFWLLRGFASSKLLMPHIEAVCSAAPFRRMTVPGGKQMSVAMTNCGAFGWTASESSYAYAAQDPATGATWPAMPTELDALARQAAALVGWSSFMPDACLINRYEAGAGMGLHQDRDERDATQPVPSPIVSVSLGTTCKFMIGGLKRTDSVTSVALHSGDVLVWGGVSRLLFHGVRPMSKAAGTLRYNLTFRKAQ